MSLSLDSQHQESSRSHVEKNLYRDHDHHEKALNRIASKMRNTKKVRISLSSVAVLRIKEECVSSSKSFSRSKFSSNSSKSHDNKKYEKQKYISEIVIENDD